MRAPMQTLPLPARLFVGGVLLAGASVFVVFAPFHQVVQPALFLSLALLAAVCGVFKVPVPFPGQHSTVSMSAAVDFASLLLLGPHPTMLVAITSAWSQSTIRARERPPTYRTLFNMAALVLTVQAAGQVYRLLGEATLPGAWTRRTVALIGSATAYFLVNTALVASATALSSRRPVFGTWRAHFLCTAPGCYLSAVLALVVAPIIAQSGYWPILLAVLPLTFSSWAYRAFFGRLEEEQQHVREISDLHLATVEALARAIDAKDHVSHLHIRRVQRYAAELARALGMSDYEIHGVRTAALLHDIGQLAVPDHILSKPGPLTHEEFDRIRTHPAVGAEIIAQVPFPYPVAPLILGHHERWDGYGYPAGLKAEEIPLGARILSVVDYFDALISDRPYHRAMPRDAAIRLLQQESGRALDPIAVARFVELVPRLLEEDDEATGDEAKARDAKSVFDDIALAHREVYTLYEIAHAMGTSLSVSETMELIASKLTRLVPFSCCARFLVDEEAAELRCRFASGLDADVIKSLTVRLGAGAIGRVAAGKPLVNGLPASDFEASHLTVATSLRSSLVCPLVRNDALVGAIALYDTLAKRYTENHGRLLMRVAEQASAVVSNSVMFEQTQVDSLTDPLTGLPNMRSLFVHAGRELARAARLQAEVSLLVLDIDHFKAINDRYGHHVGDRALREVAAILRDAVRPYDICARYAGDEFVIVLPGCGLEEANRKREELQAAVACHPLESDEDGPMTLAISCGAAAFPADGRSYEALLARADSRMYRDKAERRRRRGSYPEMPAVLPAEPEEHEGELVAGSR